MGRAAMSGQYLTAHEAAEALGVGLPTLYAYVSRGLIRSEDAGSDRRSRRYHAEDVRTLLARKERRRGAGAEDPPGPTAMPVMESAITLIAGEHFYYRGRDVLALSATSSVERVAALLWTGREDRAEQLFGGERESSPPVPLGAPPTYAELSPVERFLARLPIAAAIDPAAYDLRPSSVAATGARIVRLLAALATGVSGSATAFSASGSLSTKPIGRGAVAGAPTIAGALAAAWAPADPRARPLIEAALILCADHELNVASYAVRLLASAGATPYGVVQAGLVATQGIDQGGLTRRTGAFLREAGGPAGVRAAMAGRLARGETVPGFGHLLYPHGDPRARELLRLVAAAYPDAPAVDLARAAQAEGLALLHEHPAIDLALYTLADTLGAPPDTALTLFALARTIGWIGHAIEQYGAGRLLRPRARYVGERPEE